MPREILRNTFGRRCGYAIVVVVIFAAAARAQSPETVSFAADKNGQINFVMPSQNVQCTYTPAGGTETYKPFDAVRN
jgi:hypothetical protein